MRQNHPNGTPIYKKIQQTILKMVESGDLKPGDAVDSERELARIHRVSLMTARHALTGLEREGLVERRRGTGTFIAPPKIHFNKLERLRQGAAEPFAIETCYFSAGEFDGLRRAPLERASLFSILKNDYGV